MSNSLILVIMALGLGASLAMGADPVATQADDAHPVVVLDTTAGEITIELDREKAPITVDNFLKYVDEKFYDGLIFHRVMPDFMIQGGGLDPQLQEKQAGKHAPIRNESGNGLSNVRGTIAMARTNDPNSATNQFFINRVDNPRLDNAGGGYCVFGKVIAGLDAVDKIATVRTSIRNGMRDVPVDPPVIKSARRKPKG